MTGEKRKSIYELMDGLETGNLTSDHDDLECHIKAWTVSGFLFEEMILFLPEETVQEFVDQFRLNWEIKQAEGGLEK